MRFWVWAAISSTLLLLLWLTPHTKLVPTLRSYVLAPPVPKRPSPPSAPVFIQGSTGLTYSLYVSGSVSNSAAISIGTSPTPCLGGIRIAESASSHTPPSAASTDSLATLVISGQQQIESERQRLELDRQKDESLDKRTRLYVQAILTLLLAVACLFLLVNKKATPTQRSAAVGIIGVALGYWFK